MKKPWTNIASFEDLDSSRVFQAYLARRKLDSRVWHNPALRVLLFWRPPQSVYHVQVPGNFHHFAKELAEKNPLDILDQAIHCPQCGSLEIEYPCFTRPSLLAKAFLVPGLLLRITDHQCQCLKCHSQWSLPRRGPSAATEIHNHEPTPV